MKRIIYILLIICSFMMIASCGGGKYVNKHIDIVKTQINDTGITWPDGQVLPSFAPHEEELDAIDIRSKSNDNKSMMSAFVGVINKKKPRVMLHTNEAIREEWPELLGLNLNITKSMEEIVAKYKNEIKGLIVWDKDVPDTVNLATTVAGQRDALIVTERQLETYSTGEFSFEILEDYRGKFKNKAEVYKYMYENVWPDCDKRLIVGIKAEGWEIRDLAAGANLAVIWLDPKVVEESVILRSFLSDCTPVESYYIGWWTSEGDGVDIGSQYGVPTIPADYYYNYSIYSSMSRELEIPTVPAKPDLENKFYVSFTISDGDNLQYVQHAMKSASQLWAAEGRGQYPINWTCSSALLDAGPQILNYFYTSATENDLIISGPSGLGYTYPTTWQNETAGNDELIKYARKTQEYFSRTGFKMITVWNFITYEQADIYADNIRSLIGFSVQERFEKQLGQHPAGNEHVIPLITTSPRYDGDTERVLRIIKEEIEKWNGESPMFMMPQMISWESGVPDIIQIAEALEEEFGDKVAFVRGDHLMMLYSEANGIPYNIILGSENITASGHDEDSLPSKAADGSFSKANGWQYSGDGEKWLMADLGGEYEISRYVVKNAASGYYSSEQNTVDFKIQSSMDGSNWKDVDKVKNNKSDIVDKDVKSFNAKYVRVLIEEPGEDGIARLQEFELYGIEVK